MPEISPKRTQLVKELYRMMELREKYLLEGKTVLPEKPLPGEPLYASFVLEQIKKVSSELEYKW